MTTATATTIKASYISRLLGTMYTKSATHSTRVRGWTNTDEGFTVEQRGPFVAVGYELGDWNRSYGEERRDAIANKLALIGASLVARGYTIERATREDLTIVVTGKAA